MENIASHNPTDRYGPLIPPAFDRNKSSLLAGDCSSGAPCPYTIARAEFKKQPPENLRKSNFFNFVIELFDSNDSPIEVVFGNFVDFIEHTEEEKRVRNGIEYKLRLRFSDGHFHCQSVFVKLINAQTQQVVIYEGQDKNPQMCRVLLTHELMCSRCCERKSCGNRNETPSDPVIVDRYHLKFFMKCNQNCLKNAGNPKEMRRFQIAISTVPNFDITVAVSDKIFVHNNSKHGRRVSSRRSEGSSDPPFIRGLVPSEGWASGGTQVIIIGENFFDGLQIIFGSCVVWNVEVFSSTAMRVIAPPTSSQGLVEVCTALNSRQYCMAPGFYYYCSVTEPTMELGFHRLSKLVPRHPGDQEKLPKEIVLKRAADIVENILGLGSQPPVHPELHSPKPQLFSPPSNTLPGYFAYSGRREDYVPVQEMMLLNDQLPYPNTPQNMLTYQQLRQSDDNNNNNESLNENAEKNERSSRGRGRSGVSASGQLPHVSSFASLSTSPFMALPQVTSSNNYDSFNENAMDASVAYMSQTGLTSSPSLPPTPQSTTPRTPLSGVFQFNVNGAVSQSRPKSNLNCLHGNELQRSAVDLSPGLVTSNTHFLLASGGCPVSNNHI